MEAAEAAAAVAVGAATWSLTGNGESAVARAAVAAAPLGGDCTTPAVEAAAAVALRCDVPLWPSATWPRTRAVPQSTASAIGAVRATGPGRSCPPRTPSTSPLRPRTP